MNLIDILNTEIYPRLYENINSILPEFNFILKSGHYVATSTNKIDGSTGKKEKVYIYANNPAYIIDYTRGTTSIWNYISKKYNLDNQTTLKFLAEKAGYELPKLKKEDTESYLKEAKIYQAWEDVCQFCKQKLETQTSYLHYLTETRKFTKENIEFMEFGFLPSQKELFEYLTTLNFEKDIIDKIKLHPSIGKTHCLILPYRDNFGKCIGIIARAISNNEPKYIYSTGLEKKSTLFGLSSFYGDTLVVVEGIIDALIVKSKGYSNIVALGGTRLTEEQIEIIKRRGIKKLIFCLDNDEAGKKATIDNALSILEKDIKIELFASDLPEKYKDIDEYLQENDIKKAEESFNNSILICKFIANSIQKKLVLAKNDIDLINILKNIEDVILYFNKRDLSIFVNTISDILQAHNIDKNAIMETIEKLHTEKLYKKEKEKSLSEINNLIKKESWNEAVNLLQSLNNFSSINETIYPISSENDINKSFSVKPFAIETNIVFEKENLSIPTGALTIIAAPTNHGKTTMLINLGLDILKKHKNKKVYFFSYEEAAEHIAIKFLNTHCNLLLSNNNRRSLEYLYTSKEDGFKYIISETRSEFIDKKQDFFKNFIENGRLNIIYSDKKINELTKIISNLDLENSIIIIDYIQLMSFGGDSKYISRQEELKKICLALKDVAVSTGLPIILAAQFNREVKQEDQLSPVAIGEAGDIERVANLIIGMWNRSFNSWDKDAKKNAKQTEFTSSSVRTKSELYLKILKNRDGRANLDNVFTMDGNTGCIAFDTENKSTPL